MKRKNAFRTAPLPLTLSLVLVDTGEEILLFSAKQPSSALSQVRGRQEEEIWEMIVDGEDEEVTTRTTLPPKL